MRMTIGGVCAALALSGCMAPTPRPAPAPTVTATVTAPASKQRAESLDDWRTRLVENGLKCPDWKVVASGDAGPLSGQCSDLLQMGWTPDTPTGRNFFQASVNLSLSTLQAQKRSDVKLFLWENAWLRLDAESAYYLRDQMGGVVLGWPE